MSMSSFAKAVGKQGGSDSRYFTSSKKGENHELRQELNSQNPAKRKDAVKKVIANMTVGKDVSSLFIDITNCGQTQNVELKKLVYLYLINYAKSNPELSLASVNTFVRDSSNSNPLIRALAVRTMGCIRVEKITDYLCQPLRDGLKDDDPYVRKTAAVCVAKLYDIVPELVEDQGFLDSLRDLLSDSNPAVVANAVAALSEIAETRGEQAFPLTTSILQKLLAALNECTEWGQIFILDSLSRYKSESVSEAEGIIERVTPRLQHANSAVVLSAVKVVLRLLDQCSLETQKALTKKLAPPLVTLLNSEPEMQYIALRNINLIIQKRSNILEHEIKVFFCKYNDPIYVKLEKLEAIIRLTAEKNIDQVLLELKEYAQEADIDFVRKSVRAIGRCAVKLDNVAERCVNVLVELIKSGIDYVVQEAIIVIADIFRKYPNQYLSIISTLCENLQNLDEPDAKAAMIWIIGEYAERIENADELLESFFIETFDEEATSVQLQILTAAVKIFLKDPNETQEMVQKVLTMATEDTDNPDLRDRGFLYWRLLSTEPNLAKSVILSERPEIKDDAYTLSPDLLDELITNIATLASVHHKPPQSFIVRSNLPIKPETQIYDEDMDDDEREERRDSDDDNNNIHSSRNNNNDDEDESRNRNNLVVDLLDVDTLDNYPTNNQKSKKNNNNMLDDLLGPLSSTSISSSSSSSNVIKPCIVTSEQGKGVQINGCVVNRDGKMVFEMEVTNFLQIPIAGLALQLNKNNFGVAPFDQAMQFQTPLQPRSTIPFSVLMGCNPSMVKSDGVISTQVEAAIKNLSSKDVFYFKFSYDFLCLMSPAGELERQAFVNAWKSIDDSFEVSSTVSSLPDTNVENILRKFNDKNIFFITRRPVPDSEGQQEAVYFSMKTFTNVQFLLELTFKAGIQACKLSIKTPVQACAPLARLALENLLRS